MSEERKPAIVVAGLCKSFGPTSVLDGVDVNVPEGTILALLGPNGAGKTTMTVVVNSHHRLVPLNPAPPHPIA